MRNGQMSKKLFKNRISYEDAKKVAGSGLKCPFFRYKRWKSHKNY